jgi:aryl-alcohol dehydrogenase-like predicted oxidoreductase
MVLMSTRLGIGLAAVGRPAYITAHRGPDLGTSRTVDELQRHTHVLLDAAYAAGLRYVDVARSYGRAEEFAAHWLASRGAADVEVGSKWGYRTSVTGGCVPTCTRSRTTRSLPSARSGP